MTGPLPPIESPYKSLKGWRRIVRATMNSVAGLQTAFRHEAAFRQELLLACILIPFAFCLPLKVLEKVLLLYSVLAVLIVELLNSAIEAAIDRISLEIHHLSKRAKDLGSAAVLLSLLQLILIWSLLVPPVFFH